MVALFGNEGAQKVVLNQNNLREREMFRIIG